ncbi:hypothetical protein QCN28_16645 [Bordetella bronchiseptica]|uniref:hypothetical protein n=1 Tax=Bordetella bronchiseptica TaxID=518 RepID=UPI003F745CE4
MEATILHLDGEPTFAILPYAEYQRLLAIASSAQASRSSSAMKRESQGSAEMAVDLLAPPSCAEAMVDFAQRSPPRVPENGTIPHEVIESAAQNHWLLIRAWREYLGITPSIMARRLAVPLVVYMDMEAKFNRLSNEARQDVADALGLKREQLIVASNRRLWRELR